MALSQSQSAPFRVSLFLKGKRKLFFPQSKKFSNSLAKRLGRKLLQPRNSRRFAKCPPYPVACGLNFTVGQHRPWKAPPCFLARVPSLSGARRWVLLRSASNSGPVSVRVFLAPSPKQSLFRSFCGTGCGKATEIVTLAFTLQPVFSSLREIPVSDNFRVSCTKILPCIPSSNRLYSYQFSIRSLNYLSKSGN